jgi:hypothetical protein
MNLKQKSADHSAGLAVSTVNTTFTEWIKNESGGR